MADDQLKEEPILARLRGKSGEAPAGLTSLAGLLGRSPKPGHWLLYPNLDMSRSVEIAEPDIVHAEKLSPEHSPFGSLGGTRVFVKRDAQVTHTVSQTQEADAAAQDEFDLDVRTGPLGVGTGTHVDRHISRLCGTWDVNCGTPNPPPPKLRHTVTCRCGDERRW
jgi:hypothetical protein